MENAVPVVRLGQKLEFPSPSHTRADGLVAIGGDLSVPRLLLAYQMGIFPWSAYPVTWWSPDPRGIIEFDHFRISRRLQRKIRQNKFNITFNRRFEKVIQACACPGKNRETTWIELPLIQAYTALHHQGHAHSVECWLDGKLVGGLYGVAIGGLFAGESMFARKSDASKYALNHLINHLKSRGFTLFDIQMVSAHTEKLGASSISRKEYLKRLETAVSLKCEF